MSRSSLQEERSAETRRRLLEAAIACLNERGYTGTTTTEIAGRAGVSRGAQVHHFRHKEELVIGALEHICERRLAELEYAFEELPIGGLEFRLETLIDLMWAAFRGPSFYAWLELLIASRTDRYCAPRCARPIAGCRAACARRLQNSSTMASLRRIARSGWRASSRSPLENSSRWRWSARCSTPTSRIRRICVEFIGRPENRRRGKSLAQRDKADMDRGGKINEWNG